MKEAVAWNEVKRLPDRPVKPAMAIAANTRYQAA
jgi:hypothetical protein